MRFFNFTTSIILIFFLFLHNRCMAQNWDINLLKSINPTNPNSTYWKTTSQSTYFLPGAVAVGTLICGLANDSETAKHHSAELFLSIGSDIVISEVIKRSINEERPGDKYPNEVFVNGSTHGRSFPSGHTSLAFTTATTLSLQYHKWYVTVPAYLWASSVGYSRMYLGKHYPTDVLAGAALGIGTGYLNHWLTRAIYKPYRKKSKE
ncbi:phosphatase PAP2 family protein [Mucilaginibacter rubeus]|uniref:Phosphatase PAP2 family protein n=1 Tax=Mucilaginibacter rubeus TaxID=2027860 RepID=A0A5C1I1F7_9SPHI|nr:phosphatase PAP2 family protein [Mucilaginibacter rubeus]QEM11753.1 phosphatase PAP2 family protein [Mucilaginibacter rubeus]